MRLFKSRLRSCTSVHIALTQIYVLQANTAKSRMGWQRTFIGLLDLMSGAECDRFGSCVLLEAAESTVAVFCTHMDIWSFCPLSADLSFLCNVIWVSCLFMLTESNSTVFDHYIVSLKSSRYHPPSLSHCVFYTRSEASPSCSGVTHWQKVWNYGRLIHLHTLYRVIWLDSCSWPVVITALVFLPCNLAKLRPVAWRLLS